MGDLHHKAALYDLLLDTVPDYAVFLLNPEGMITEWNPAIGRLFGYSEGDLVGKHIETIFTEEDRNQGAPANEIRLATQNGRATDLHWHLRKTGPPLFVDALVVALKEDDTVKQILKVVRDITPHELVGGLLNPLTESMEDPVFLKDTSGRFIFITDSAAALLGMNEKAQCVFMCAADCWPEPIAQRWTELDRTVMRDGKSVEFELPICLKGENRCYSFRETPWRNSTGQVVGLVAVGRDVTDRRRLEQERNELLHREKALLSERVRSTDLELNRSQQQLSSLAGRLLAAQEEERRRIARDMHDDLAQRLAVLNIELETLQEEQNGGVRVPDRNLAKIIHSVSLITEGVREISHRLHPTILEDLGLRAALRKLGDEFARTYHLRVEVSVHLPPDSAIPLELSTAMYHIVQEALRNTIKHSQGASATVELKERGDQEALELTIRDDGPGFVVSTVADTGRGLGLASMEERAQMAGGRLTLISSPGAGTEITVVLPWNKEVLAD